MRPSPQGTLVWHRKSGVLGTPPRPRQRGMSGHTGVKAGLQTQAQGHPASDPGRSPCSSTHIPPQSCAGLCVHTGSFLPHPRGPGRASLALAQARQSRHYYTSVSDKHRWSVLPRREIFTWGGLSTLGPSPVPEGADVSHLLLGPGSPASALSEPQAQRADRALAMLWAVWPRG